MIRILFIDTTALLGFFVSDKSTHTMRWLFSLEDMAKENIAKGSKAKENTSKERVAKERMAKEKAGRISTARKDTGLATPSAIEWRYIINNQVVAEFEECISHMINNNKIRQATADSLLNLFNTHYKARKLKLVGKDASIQKTIEGMHHFLGGISRPILVTSNPLLAADVQTQGYQTINPQTQSAEEITAMVAGLKTVA